MKFGGAPRSGDTVVEVGRMREPFSSDGFTHSSDSTTATGLLRRPAPPNFARAS